MEIPVYVQLVEKFQDCRAIYKTVTTGV